MKKKITSQLLIRDYGGTKKQILFSFFVIAGAVCILLPLFSDYTWKDRFINMALFSLLGIPFCVVGMKYILEAKKDKKLLKNGNYEIREDYVTHKQMLQRGRSSDTSDSYCQLDFYEYSEKSGKAVVVSRKVYQETKNGDKFYMIYLDGSLLGYYPQSKYEL